MTKMTHEEPHTTHALSTTQAIVLLFMTMVDTTWRVFVPTLGGTFLGIWLDGLFKTAPYITIVTILIGCGVSALLIVQQLRRVRRMR